MKNNSRKPGTRAFALCVIALTALFAFAMTACDNDPAPVVTPTTQALTGTVTIKGQVKVGVKLEADVSNLNAKQGFKYEWELAPATNQTFFVPINGATGKDYTVLAKDEGSYIRVTVTADGFTGSVSSVSHEVKSESYVYEISGTVTITGYVKPGAEVEANVEGLNAKQGLSYKWESGDSETGAFTAISGATNKKYTVDVAEGKYIRVTVNAEGYTGTVSSAPYKVFPQSSEAPVIGSVEIGGYEGAQAIVNRGWDLTLTATVKNASGAAVEEMHNTVSWSVSGNASDETAITDGVLSVPIAETAETLTVKAASTIDPTKFKELTVTVNTLFLKDFGDVSVVNAEGTVVGLFKVGDVVKASTANMTATTTATRTFKYQWQYSDEQWLEREDATQATNIAGATGESYTIGDIAKGKYIRVIVTLEGYEGVWGSFTAKVRAGEPSVTSVTINNKGTGTITMLKGRNRTFSSTIEGDNLEDVDKGVTWSMTGSTNSGTTLSSSGYLVVSTDDPASSLQVTVTSVLDNSKSDTVTVTLEAFDGKTLTITGLAGQSGTVLVNIMEDLTAINSSITGSGTINNGTVTVNINSGSTPWKDGGEYYIQLKDLNFGFDTFVYTNGAALNSDLNENPKYDFQETDTTIDFSKFKLVPYVSGGHTVTITGLDDYNGAVVNMVVATYVTFSGSFNAVANGYSIISDGTATFTLKTPYTPATAWTGNATTQYCISELSISNVDKRKDPWYVYTNGQTLAELNITNKATYNTSAPKVLFAVGGTTSLSLNQFVETDILK